MRKCPQFFFGWFLCYKLGAITESMFTSPLQLVNAMLFSKKKNRRCSIKLQGDFLSQTVLVFYVIPHFHCARLCPTFQPRFGKICALAEGQQLGSVGKGLRFGVGRSKVWGVISRYNMIQYPPKLLGVSDVFAVLFGKWKWKKIEKRPSILKMHRLLLNCQLPTLGCPSSQLRKSTKSNSLRSCEGSVKPNMSNMWKCLNDRCLMGSLVVHNKQYPPWN